MRKVAKYRILSANDNEPTDGKRLPKVTTDWPEEIPIKHTELDLLELYLADLIPITADNDN